MENKKEQSLNIFKKMRSYGHKILDYLYKDESILASFFVAYGGSFAVVMLGVVFLEINKEAYKGIFELTVIALLVSLVLLQIPFLIRSSGWAKVVLFFSWLSLASIIIFHITFLAAFSFKLITILFFGHIGYIIGNKLNEYLRKRDLNLNSTKFK